jgi:hypothetical protein
MTEKKVFYSLVRRLCKLSPQKKEQLSRNKEDTLMAAERVEHSFCLGWDDFQQGFSVGSPNTKWFYFSVGPYMGDGGIATTSACGLG